MQTFADISMADISCQDIGVVEEPDRRVEPDRFPSPRPEAVRVFFFPRFVFLLVISSVV